MKRINHSEAQELLNKLVTLRKKCKISKSQKLHSEYRKYQSICVDKFDYLVETKTRKYKRFSNYDDLKQDGRIALLLALKSYEPTKGNFFWWANRYIKTRISREANHHSSFKIPIKQTKLMQPYKVSSLPIIVDHEISPLDQIEKNEIKSMIVSAIDRLPIDQKKIIELNGIKSHSISQISRELKIPRGDCIKLLNEAKKNLKTVLENGK